MDFDISFALVKKGKSSETFQMENFYLQTFIVDDLIVLREGIRRRRIASLQENLLGQERKLCR